MRKLLSFFLVFMLLGLLSFEAEAQRRGRTSYRKSSKRISSFTRKKAFNKRKQYWTFGVGGGATTYLGDIAPQNNRGSFAFDQTRYTFGVFAGRRVHPNVTARLNLNYIRLTGDDQDVADAGDASSATRYIRNLSFSNNIVEANLSAYADLFANNGSYLRRANFNPFVFAGIGAFYHNPTTEGPDGNTINLREIETEGESYSPLGIVVPFGIGVKYSVAPNFDLGLEIGYRLIFTDYIDDVSGNYPTDLSGYSADELAVIFRSAEDPIQRAGLEEAIAAAYGPNAGSVSANTVTDEGLEYIRFHGPGDIRGDDSDNDQFVVTQLTLSYIMGTTARRPKFR